MQVIGKDIGSALDEMYAALERRVRVEAERELRVEPFEGGSFSNVSWSDGAVVVSVHTGVPRHALPHVFGVALQHVRQRLDLYPAVVRPRPPQKGPRPGRDHPAAPLVRTALRELVLGPEADQQLEPLGLDTEWETEQRHAGFKELLRGADESWDRDGVLEHAFAVLQYARFALTHPPGLWEGLRKQAVERLPAAAERGERVAGVVRRRGWNSPGACVEALVAARDELKLQPIAAVEDRRSGRTV